MPNLLWKTIAASALLSAGALTFDANALPVGAGGRLAAEDIAGVQTVAHCFYSDGWSGPGYYRCGYRLRRGLGWYGVTAPLVVDPGPVVVVPPSRRAIVRPRPLVVAPY
jgi:hypothetical protein